MEVPEKKLESSQDKEPGKTLFFFVEPSRKQVQEPEYQKKAMLVNSGPGWGAAGQVVYKLTWSQVIKVGLDNCASKTQTTVSCGGKT